MVASTVSFLVEEKEGDMMKDEDLPKRSSNCLGLDQLILPQMVSLQGTNISLTEFFKKHWRLETTFHLGRPIFGGYVSFSEGSWFGF